MAFLRLLGLFSLYLQNISPINIRKLFYLHVNINKLNINSEELWEDDLVL
jgi:hypothetical protein